VYRGDLEKIRSIATVDVVVKRWFGTFRPIVEGVEPDKIWSWSEMMLISDHRGRMVMPRSKKDSASGRRQGAVHVTYIAAFTAVGRLAAVIPPTLVMRAI
jgi:hypothetical protein